MRGLLAQARSELERALEQRNGALAALHKAQASSTASGAGTANSRASTPSKDSTLGVALSPQALLGAARSGDEAVAIAAELEQVPTISSSSWWHCMCVCCRVV